LYYRLNVFPIDVPPLRARGEDIPALVEHFIDRFARKLGRRVAGLAPGVLDRLMAHDWPGNVRELQNTIERALILSSGDRLTIDWPLGGGLRAAVVRAPPDSSAAAPVARGEAAPIAHGAGETLVEVERQHIIAVLRRTDGVIEGPMGAAKLLDMKPSTTRYRMKKLGIRKADYLA
jgi:transcriptional regulator with GAF, ATPase, and Fis domain